VGPRSRELVIWVWKRLIWRRATLCNRGSPAAIRCTCMPGDLDLDSALVFSFGTPNHISPRPTNPAKNGAKLHCSSPNAVPPRILAFTAQKFKCQTIFSGFIPHRKSQSVQLICRQTAETAWHIALAQLLTRQWVPVPVPVLIPFPIPLWTRNGIGKC